jgi:hypothetical protein
LFARQQSSNRVKRSVQGCEHWPKKC